MALGAGSRFLLDVFPPCLLSQDLTSLSVARSQYRLGPRPSPRVSQDLILILAWIAL